MKKVIYIAIISVIAIFCLQGLWISNMYRAYVAHSVEAMEKAISASLAKEISFRHSGASPYKDPKHPKIVNKTVDDMTPGERSQLKGDTLDLELLTQKNIGSSLPEVITQFTQDDFIKEGKYILLPKLDSIFSQELKKANVAANHSILLYNKDTTVINTIGTLSANKQHVQSTKLFPIGTKGLQFIQVKADISLSPFLREMLFILMESILLVLIILGCVVCLVIMIRRKDKLFKQREASVNGTVHDLKAPLNNVITLMSYLKKKLPEESLQKLLEDTAGQAKDLVSDIDALLVTARRDRRRISLQKTETDLLQLIGYARESIAAQYRGKPHQIILKSEWKEVKLILDPLYVTNVIRNLLENALKYSDDGVRVTIKVKRNQKEVALAVEDDGWGIEKKYQKKIFTQFFQVPREQVKHQRGYGVGLAYTKYIMEAHGGSILVESEPGKGSIFICKFPVE